MYCWLKVSAELQISSHLINCTCAKPMLHLVYWWTTLLICLCSSTAVNVDWCWTRRESVLLPRFIAVPDKEKRDVSNSDFSPSTVTVNRILRNDYRLKNVCPLLFLPKTFCKFKVNYTMIFMQTNNLSYLKMVPKLKIIVMLALLTFEACFLSVCSWTVAGRECLIATASVCLYV